MFIQIATESNFKIRVLKILYSTVFKLKIVERKYLEKITILQPLAHQVPWYVIFSIYSP